MTEIYTFFLSYSKKYRYFLNYSPKFEVFCALKNGIWSELVSIILNLNNFLVWSFPKKCTQMGWIHKTSI